MAKLINPNLYTEWYIYLREERGIYPTIAGDIARLNSDHAIPVPQKAPRCKIPRRQPQEEIPF